MKSIGTTFSEGRKRVFATFCAFVGILAGSTMQGAGVLKPVDSGLQSLEIRDHQAHVTLNNGFARTEVSQTFFNPNQQDLEAVYTFPLPEHASLSEMTIWAGEKELQGEVVEKAKAEQVYEEETANGNEAGLAQKDSYKHFEFWVSPVPAQGEVRMRVVYYQPLKLDTGIGSYKYPLEEGGTDTAAVQFWTRNEVVTGNLSIDVEVKSAWPLKGIRTPGFQGTETTDAEGDLIYSYQSNGGDLTKDFVLYYMLEDNLPGRVEVIPFRDSSDKAGTFMMVVT
ncbi:MAG: VIT domain-containing protein, partial [Verrucomicrobiia bacterium]